MNRYIFRLSALAAAITIHAQAHAQDLPDDALDVVEARSHQEINLRGPRLDPADRLDQQDIEQGQLSLRQIRKAGMLVFTTPFNKADGYGDGPGDPLNPDNISPVSGNRPTLQGNGTFLRVNGLDAQTCLECHTIVSNAEVPARLGVGGVGGISSSPMFQPDLIDVADLNRDGIADFSGRLINPPFLFGSGGVELVGLEMTRDLQALRQQALDNPGSTIELSSKGVYFGRITADSNGHLDTSELEGIDEDLVVRPFGRKGEFATVREFDVGAMAFHFGMQATEEFGVDTDQDGDGVFNEMAVGDLSALSIFNTTMDRPRQARVRGAAREGEILFNTIGCADCHIPQMNTETRHLPYKLIGSPEAPFEDSFYSVNLTRPPMSFRRNQQGGIQVNMFSDLKRHFMGTELSETFFLATDQQNEEFITPRLWGIADTAPYLHDGRALTLFEAISLHDNPGSEAAFAGQNFKALSEEDQTNLVSYLFTLRTPTNPNRDVVPR